MNFKYKNIVSVNQVCASIKEVEKGLLDIKAGRYREASKVLTKYQINIKKKSKQKQQ